MDIFEDITDIYNDELEEYYITPLIVAIQNS